MERVTGLTLSTELYREVLSHARRSLPREAVGLLGGKAAGQVMVVLPLLNIAAGDWTFIADPFAQFCALRRLQSENLELLAIYHSHPGGGVEPSKDDLAYATEWRCIQLIVAVDMDAQSDDRLRAFRFDKLGAIEDVEIRLSSSGVGRAAH